MPTANDFFENPYLAAQGRAFHIITHVKNPGFPEGKPGLGSLLVIFGSSRKGSADQSVQIFAGQGNALAQILGKLVHGMISFHND